MKKLVVAGAVALLGLIGGVANAAGSVGANVSVNVSLNAQCKVNTATNTVDFGTYTAFGSASISAPTAAIIFECTRGLAISSTAFDTITDGTSAGVGVVGGLQYSLATSGGTAVAGTAASTSTVGTGDLRTYTITGAMPTGQAGLSGGSTTQARVFTISY